MFPFFTPDVTRKNLTNLGIADKYDYSRPKATPVPKVLNTLTGIRYVFDDFQRFHQIYTADMEMLTNGYGFLLNFDDKKKHDTDLAMVWHALFPDQQTVSSFVDWYKQTTVDMIKQKSIQFDGVAGKRVDIVRNVINLVSVHWAADKLVRLYC